MSRQWVLIRGLTREQGHWGKFKDMLQEQDPESEVLCIDLPGCGEYHRLSSPFTMDGIAEFIHSHFKGERPKQRYVLAISLGGMVAVELARLYPDSMDALVIMNSSFKNLSPMYHRLQLEALQYFYRGLMASNNEERESAVLDMVSNLPSDSKEREKILKDWVDIAIKRPVTKINFLKQIFAAAMYNLPLEKPAFPVLILTSYADRMVDPRCSQKLAEQWQAPLIAHTTAGHELCLDEPQWVIDKVKKHFNI